MKRDKEFRTAIGQSAWLYYQEWMRLQRRRQNESKSFISSRFFNQFLKFARFVKDVHMPDPKKCIWLMVDKNMPPSLWTHNDCYGMYLEFIDIRGEPMKQAELTIKTIQKIADAAGCDDGDVLSYVTSAELIHLLRQRRLSPWILLRSKKFGNFLRNTTPDTRIAVDTIIRPKRWIERFKKHPNDVKIMDQFVKELNL